ncbi:MAG: Fic family protein, partial [Candidatus Altiarchaeota archaeon]|nr:Fic family protein [Candidatus Altiarchaeota archaeon]
MNEKDFTSDRAGRLFWEQNGFYHRFEPKSLPFEYKVSEELNSLLFETSLNLGRLDGIACKFSPEEVELLITPFMYKEATLSSEIEGTRATLSDVYKSEKEPEKDREKALDTEEVKNYIKALKFGLEEIKSRDLSEDFVKELHKILLKGVRGENKSPGEYKTSQNAIGKSTDTTETAKFVPASPQSVPPLMRNLVAFLNKKDSANPLFKVALAHYQFEAIHPFRDGNGRVGRLIIMIYMCKEGVLKQPLLYISEYFKSNRDEYTDRLFNVSSKGEFEEWIYFFLKALNEQSKKSLGFAMELEDYKKELKAKLQKKYKTTNLLSIVDMLFENPYITIKDVTEKLGVTPPAAAKLMDVLKKEKILEEITGKERRRMFLARGILKILEL